MVTDDETGPASPPASRASPAAPPGSNTAAGVELVRYPADGPPELQAWLVRQGTYYLVETAQGRVRLTPRQAEVLVGSIRYYQRCRDADLQQLCWRVMTILGCNSELCEAFFWDYAAELGCKRPIDIFEEGSGDERIIELARTIVRRRDAVPEPAPAPRRRARRGKTDQ